MLNETDLKSLLSYLIPTDLENTQDKASIASVCRTTADSKMSGICTAPDHVPFVWTCLEHHKTPVMTRLSSSKKNAHALTQNLAQAFEDGAHFCEVSLPHTAAFIEDNFPPKKIIAMMPYHAVQSRDNAIAILNQLGSFQGICLKHDGIADVDKLTAVFQIFEGVKDAQNVPGWLLFDLPPNRTAPLFAQNVLRLSKKTIHGLGIKISFHLPPKTIKYFTAQKGHLRIR